MNINRRLLELLVTRSSGLMERLVQSRSGQTEIRLADVVDFWRLNTVNNFIPLLKHFSAGVNHPENVYMMLLQLAGQLTTYSEAAMFPPRGLPVYEHHNLSEGFNQLESQIKKLLGETRAVENFIAIPIEKLSEMISRAKVSDATLLQDAEFYLRATHDMPEQQVADELPADIRIASPEILNHVLNAATKALQVHHVMRPPAGLMPKTGIQYFRLDKHGQFWESIANSKAFGIYLPNKFKEIKLELIAVRNN